MPVSSTLAVPEPSSSRPTSGGAGHSLRSLVQNRAYGFYTGNRVAAGLGMTVQTAAMAWQVYELTGSALSLAFLGLFRFLPHLLISSLGGAVADTTDRRLILGLSTLAPLGTSTLLWALTATGTISPTPIYVSVVMLGLAGAFEGPARASLLPQLVPRASFQRALAATTTVTQLSMVIGPAVGGLIIAQLGVAPAYLFHVFVLLVGLGLLAGVRVRPESNPSGSLSLAMVVEGLAFIRAHPAVLGAMALDMFAVIFASADALLPIFAKDILDVGAVGFGLLASSKSVGALATSIVLVLLSPIVSAGRALVITVVLFGLATIAFGFSPWFPLSLFLYGLLSAFDQVSVVVRQMIIQLGTPDALRGRVSSVNFVFIGASNQLGAVRAGLVTAWTGDAVLAVTTGGVGCLVAVAAVLALIPSLWRHRVDLGAAEAEGPPLGHTREV